MLKFIKTLLAGVILLASVVSFANFRTVYLGKAPQKRAPHCYQEPPISLGNEVIHKAVLKTNIMKGFEAHLDHMLKYLTPEMMLRSVADGYPQREPVHKMQSVVVYLWNDFVDSGLLQMFLKKQLNNIPLELVGYIQVDMKLWGEFRFGNKMNGQCYGVLEAFEDDSHRELFSKMSDITDVMKHHMQEFVDRHNPDWYPNELRLPFDVEVNFPEKDFNESVKMYEEMIKEYEIKNTKPKEIYDDFKFIYDNLRTLAEAYGGRHQTDAEKRAQDIDTLERNMHNGADEFMAKMDAIMKKCYRGKDKNAQRRADLLDVHRDFLEDFKKAYPIMIAADIQAKMRWQEAEIARYKRLGEPVPQHLRHNVGAKYGVTLKRSFKERWKKFFANIGGTVRRGLIRLGIGSGMYMCQTDFQNDTYYNGKLYKAGKKICVTMKRGEVCEMGMGRIECY